MANPQKENGHTGIANELLEPIIAAKLNGTEYAVLLYVIRKTYGYLKPEDWISYTQFEKATNRTRPNVWKAIESLVTKKILVTKKELGKTLYRLNKDYTQWVVTKTKLVTKKKLSSYEKEMEVVTKTKPTKETITKETIQKKYMSLSDFEKFWELYPRRENRKKAQEKFLKLKVELLPIILKALKVQKDSDSWRSGYVPHATTWINGERWNDEVKMQQPKYKSLPLTAKTDGSYKFD